MISGFSRLALSALFFGFTSLAAETATTPAATPAPDDKKPKLGYVRLWNMLPAESGEFLVVQDKPGAAEPEPILSAQPMNVYADYVGLKPGRYPLKIVRAADPKTALKTFDVILKQDVFVTFYLHSDEGQFAAEMLDDTYDLEKAVSGKIVIRHFLKDTTVTVKSAALTQAAVLRFGEERTLENIPLKPVVFQMEARLANGQVKNWASEVDFRATRHASLFLVLDVYGRFRPRTSADGQAETSAAP